MATSQSTSLIFFGVILGCPSALIISSLKSLISKSFESHELGKMFAFLSGSETFSNLVGNMLFNAIYFYTVNAYPGMAFFIDASLFFVLMIALIVSEIAHRTPPESESMYMKNDIHMPTNKPNKHTYGTLKGSQEAIFQ